MAPGHETSSHMHPEMEEQTEDTTPTATVQNHDHCQQSSDGEKQPRDGLAPDSASSQDGDVEAIYPEWPKRFQDVQPKIHECNYHQFKNFHSDKEMNAAVYALYGSQSLRNDINKEKAWRQSPNTRRSDARESTKGSGKESDPTVGGDPVGNKVLHRIRIQSAYILKQLHKLTGQDYDTSKHYVFFRPFMILIHLQPQMKEILEDLRNKWAGTSMTETPEPEEGSLSLELDFDSGELLDSKHAWAHMETYIRFVDDKVMPLEEQFRSQDNGRTKVAFEDLSYLFQEGQYVYRPLPSNKRMFNDASSASSSSMSSTYQVLWRVYSVVLPYVPSDPDSAALTELDDKDEQFEGYESADGDDDSNTGNDDILELYCYYIDFDGDSYSPACRCVRIKKYDGEKAIRSLPIYPVRYLDNEGEFLDKQRKSGEDFMSYVRQRHVYHFGWTVSHHPIGSSIRDGEKYPEFIDSEFIIDFQEAYQTSPFWKPDYSHTPSINSTLTASWRTDGCSDDSVETWRWSTNINHRHVHDCTIEIDMDTVGGLHRNKFLMSNAFLSESRRGNFIEPQGTEACLLPKRLVGFALRERKFVNVTISSIRHIEEQSEAFEMLRIDASHKTMVRSLVKEHFRLKARRAKGDETMNQDIIKGKGTGLVFLLHGVPGVGKTATAEAIAQENKTPLFAITCGDLGVEPMQVEKNLTRIFRWATIWGCILLLDEADVFFTRRNPSDLKRNALVTVFLRILEYYSGILFLTTNRVGIMDEAFKSRIHISLYYPPLDLKQTKQIFQYNIDRLEKMEAAETDETHKITIDGTSIMIWAEHHFKTNPELGRWNGRQIRNAFQTAASLAHFDALNPQGVETGVKPGVLNYVQLDKVAQATRQFDEYMAKVRRATDGEFARRGGIRRDDHADIASSVAGTERAFGTPQHHRDMPPTRSKGQNIDVSQDTLYHPAQRHLYQPQRLAQEDLYQSPEYGQGTSPQAYNSHSATTTPSRAPPQHTSMHQADPGISMEYGYRTQVVGHLDVRDERSPQNLNMATRVKQPYVQPDEYDARPYTPSQRPSAQRQENLPPGYQESQLPRHRENTDQEIWEG